MRRHIHLHPPREHPRPDSDATTASTASDEPATTVVTGPFSAATTTAPPNGATTASTSTAGNSTTAIAPRPEIRRNKPLRSQITRAASDNDNAPATYAAATSPIECPTTAAGTTPHDRHNAANPTSTANNTGCTTSIPSGTDSPSNTSTNDQSTNSANAAAHSPNTPRNTGSERANSRPIPHH